MFKLGDVGISGKYRMVVSKDREMKQVVSDTGFFDNLITDVGLHRIGSVNASSLTSIANFNNLCGRFVVGAGNADPRPEDTALQSPIAYANEGSANVSESSSYDRGYYELVVSYQFGQGEAVGNISEIGLQHTSLTGPLFSRSRVKDEAGDPTTITVRPDDFLTCFYTLRIKIPKEDAVFNINVTVNDDVIPTKVTARPLNADSSNPLDGWGLATVRAGSYGPSRWFDGGLSLPTARDPLGSSVSRENHAGLSIVPYDPVNNPFKRWVKQDVGLDDHNGDNLRTVSVRCLMGRWQLEFDPPLKKDNTQKMEMTFGYSWSRADVS